MTIQESNKLSSLFFYTGFLLICILAGTFLISSLFFFLKIPMGPWQFPLGILAASLLSYYTLTRSREKQDLNLYLVFGIPLVLVFISIAVSGYFYDVSFDGQAYHQEALIQMKNGWNPYFEYLPKTVNQVIWVNHYAKGMETVQTAIYCATGNIETGKATNVILWLASLFLTVSLIIRNQWVSLPKAVILSILLAGNPIVLNQMPTYYVDGALGSLLLCLIVTGISILQTPRTRHLLILSITIFLLVNVKFTATLYIAVFVGGFWIWALLNKETSTAKKIWWTSVAAGIVGIVCGFNPYITNTVNFGNPLYPLMGKNKVDIIYALNLPAGFEHKTGVERFVLSLFSRTDNLYPKSPYPIELKLPFTFNKIDLAHAPMVDARLAGFGPMFSGILLLSLVILVVIYRNARKEQFFKNMIWMVVLIVVSVIVMPESWWSRYIPQFWLLPAGLLLSAEVLFSNRNKILKRLLYASILINLLFCLLGFIFNLLLTTKINYQLALLKSSSETVLLDLGDSQSNRLRFSRNKIPYKISKFHGTGVNEEYMAGSQACFIWPAHVDKSIQEPWLLRKAGRLLPFMWQYYGR
ncbi:hypothetical protein [Pedobacter hartonius]|uniref:Dolichyl-phosphate-mannose-protein mannosyltransferase n=1 Tax=Pedobacter hartonius TaxID=425514 RepID=A0A1H4GJU5_9SPHI|nr:hypothetical protein [Pedobacter hartonius]SEB09777.1 hypothetical protein SAMN05443550_110124 [Pedobacter hartonius]